MTKEEQSIVSRMAPSPTGPFHVGGMRTLLFNYLFAKHYNGQFKLRIEDTDKERSKIEFEEGIIESIRWLGLDFDEFMRQSDELVIHQGYVKKLLDKDLVYFAEESNDGTGQVIRFRNPNKKVVINDMVLGEVVFDTTDLGDFIIARNIESPLYHLAVVIDDHRMKVTHVIRAQEHLANTPRQILLIEALGFEIPNYAHIPFILGPDGKKKLSKRDADVNILDYRDSGYLPEAMVNFLAFIGFNPGGEQEIYSLNELVAVFDLAKVQKGPAGFNVQKLNWLNKKYLDNLTEDAWLEMSQNFWGEGQWDNELKKRMVKVIRERVEFFGQLKNQMDNHEYEFFKSTPVIELEKIGFKGQSIQSVKENLLKSIKVIQEIKNQQNNNFPSIDMIKTLLMAEADKAENGRGNMLWPLRYALSGLEKSPDPFSIIAVLGLEESIERLKDLLNNL